MVAKFNVVYRKEDKVSKERFWPKVGHATDDGQKISIRLDSLPLSQEWDGWLYLFEKIELDNTKSKSKKKKQGKKILQDDDREIEF